MPVSVGYLGLIVRNHQHSSALGDGGTLTSATQLNSANLLSLILVMG